MRLPLASPVLAFVLATACATPEARAPSAVPTPDAGGPGPSSVAAADAPSSGATAVEFDDASERFLTEWSGHHPSAAVQLGHHAFDGRLPDMAPDALLRRAAWLEKSETAFARFAPERLTERQRIERSALLASIRGERFELQVLRAPWRNPMSYLQPLSLIPYLTRPYAPLRTRAAAVARLARAAPAYLRQAEANLEAELPRPWVQTALLITEGMITFAREEAPRALEEPSPYRRRETESALAVLADALAEYRDALRGRLSAADDSWRLGGERLVAYLEASQGIRLDLAQLRALVEADLARNQAAVEATARLVDPHRDPSEVMAEVLADKPSPGRVLEVATTQARRLHEFLEDGALVPVPASAGVEVRETPPFMRWNFAFLSSPGPFETRPLPSFYYVSPPDPEWPTERQQAYVPAEVDLLFTTVHEVWPGHFLHMLRIRENQSDVLRTFTSYVTTEGWAHYAEELMVEADLADGDPRVHLGQLQNALLRDVRFLSTLGLHTGELTVEDSARLFREVAYADPVNADQQAVRGTFDPLYLAYTLGKLALLEMRQDMKEREGADFDLSAFHDQVLAHGAAPIPALRRALLGPDAGPPLVRWRPRTPPTP